MAGQVAALNGAAFGMRGGVQTFANPYGTRPVEMPMSNKYYLTDRQGRYVGTDDPSANPNDGSTGDWRRMERVGK